MQFEVERGHGPQPYYWRITTGYGPSKKEWARSEMMYNKADVLAAARKMKFHTSDYKFEVFTTKDQTHPFSWHAQAENGRLLVSSAYLYTTYATADEAKEYVRRNASSAEIVDNTGH